MRRWRTLVCCLSAASAAGAAAAAPPPTAAPRPPYSVHSGAITRYQNGAPWEAENGAAQGARVGDTVYVSGQFSHDRQGKFVGEGDISKQTDQTLQNLDQVLNGLGSSKKNILEIEVFLINPAKNFEGFTAGYKRYVGDQKLAVTLIGVTALAYPQELVEIRAIAHASR